MILPHSPHRRPIALLPHLLGFLGLVVTAGCMSRSESTVVVYSALDQEFSSPLLKAFERESFREGGGTANRGSSQV